MHPIEIHFAVFVFLVAALFVFVFLACLYAWKARILVRANERQGNAYAELVSGSTQREATLLTEIKQLSGRVVYAEAAADRLAPVVAQYLKDIDDTAALLKDETPLALKAEREALAFHYHAQNLRASHQITPPHETTTKV